MNQINIFGCGGCGITSVARFMKDLEDINASAPDFPVAAVPHYVGSSNSDIADLNPNASNVHLMRGIDGNGKLRNSANMPAIVAHAKEIVGSTPTSKYNIIVSSLTGGTGSLLLPVILNELMEDPESINLVIAVDSKDSIIEIKNSINTLKGFKALALKRGRPVVVRYFQNNEITPRAVVDQEVTQTLLLLNMLMSGVIQKQDSNDISNFVDYHKVTDAKPDLVFLEISKGDAEIVDSEHIPSALKLIDPDNQSEEEDARIYAYSNVGETPEKIVEAVDPNMFPMVFSIVRGRMDELLVALDSILADELAIEEKLQTNAAKAEVNVADLNDDGLIL